MSLTGGSSPIRSQEPPPTLPGAGGRFVEPTLGHTIIQVTESANSGTFAGVSYGNRSSFNYDNTKLLINTATGAWSWYAFNPTTLTLTTTRNAITNASIMLNPMIWDFTGTANDVFLWVVNSATPSNRLFKTYNAATDTSVTIKDFRSALQISGVVETGTLSTVFTHTAGNPTSPITDLDTHFFVNQQVLFSGNVTAALANDTAIISAYDPILRTFTVGAGLSVAPAAGDTFVVEPVGSTGQFEATLDGRWLMAAITHGSGVAGQDRSRIFIAWDRTNNVSYVGYMTGADISNTTVTCGAHQIHATHKNGRPYLWISVEGTAPFAFVVWDVLDNVFFDAVSFSHADTGPDGQLATQVGFGGIGVRTVDDPTSIATVYTPPQKDYGGGVLKNAWNTTYYEGWTAQKRNSVIHSSYVGDAYITGMVSDTAPIYRKDSFTNFAGSSRGAHLTPANLGEVWVNGATCTYMGTGKASIVASGQWAYDPTGSAGIGQLWVRGAADEDLSSASNKVMAWDWRYQQDEIQICYLTGDTASRLCKAYTRVTASGASASNAGIYCNQSRDGRFGVFSSTWGNRSRRDAFIVVIDQAIAATARPAASAVPAATATPAATLRPTVFAP